MRHLSHSGLTYGVVALRGDNSIIKMLLKLTFHSALFSYSFPACTYNVNNFIFVKNEPRFYHKTVCQRRSFKISSSCSTPSTDTRAFISSLSLFSYVGFKFTSGTVPVVRRNILRWYPPPPSYVTT